MPGKKIDEKTKQNVIKSYENGVPKKKIAERFGISLSSVGRIVKKKAKPDVKAERQKRIEDLERRIEVLENRILELRAGRKTTGFCRSRS